MQPLTTAKQIGSFWISFLLFLGGCGFGHRSVTGIEAAENLQAASGLSSGNFEEVRLDWDPSQLQDVAFYSAKITNPNSFDVVLLSANFVRLLDSPPVFFTALEVASRLVPNWQPINSNTEVFGLQFCRPDGAHGRRLIFAYFVADQFYAVRLSSNDSGEMIGSDLESDCD